MHTSHPILAALLLTVMPHSSFASTPAEKTKQELIEIERRIGAANLNCDYKYFALIEAPEFIFTAPDGSLTTRQQDLAGEAACKKSTSTYEVDDAQVWRNGSTAVVTGRVTIRRSDPERRIASRTRFTDVFVRRDHRWQLIAGHSSRIAAPSS